MVTQRDATNSINGRGWSWAAPVAAVVVWAAGIPTFGLSIIFAPLTFLLSLVAWRRAPLDVVFWIGLALNRGSGQVLVK
jgi:hypothetical protein